MAGLCRSRLRCVAALVITTALLLVLLRADVANGEPHQHHHYQPAQGADELRDAHALLSASLASILAFHQDESAIGSLYSCGKKYAFALEVRKQVGDVTSSGGSDAPHKRRGEAETLLLLEAVAGLEAQLMPGSLQHLATLVLSACVAQHAGVIESMHRLTMLQLATSAARQASALATSDAATSRSREHDVKAAVQEIVSESEELWRAVIAAQKVGAGSSGGLSSRITDSLRDAPRVASEQRSFPAHRVQPHATGRGAAVRGSGAMDISPPPLAILVTTFGLIFSGGFHSQAKRALELVEAGVRRAWRVWSGVAAAFGALSARIVVTEEREAPSSCERDAAPWDARQHRWLGSYCHPSRSPRGAGLSVGHACCHPSRHYPPFIFARLPAPAIPPVEDASAEEATPSAFLCPITREVFIDPVCCEDGWTYERCAIQQWLHRNNSSPMTNVALQHKHLVPNYALRTALLNWQEELSTARRQ